MVEFGKPVTALIWHTQRSPAFRRKRILNRTGFANALHRETTIWVPGEFISGSSEMKGYPSIPLLTTFP